LHLGTVLGRHARSRSGHLAVAFEDQHLTWREFDAGVNRAANALLGLGLRQGDALALVLPNCLELIDLYWAAAKTGAAFRMRPESVVLRAGSLAFNLVCLAAAINDDADHRVLPGPAFHHDQARRFQGIQGPILGLPIDLKALEDRRRQKDRPRLLAARLEPDRQPNG
jgi:non-ribosomal peptide synthetase component F